MFQNRITLTGATQFSAATAVATFLEGVPVTLLGPNMCPRILGYSYNSLGDAHTVVLRLAPAVGAAVNLQIDLETPTSAVNSFSYLCGKGGPVIPRDFGLQNNASQALDTPLGSPNNALPLVALFSTTGKTGNGTFRIWWDYIDTGGDL